MVDFRVGGRVVFRDLWLAPSAVLALATLTPGCARAGVARRVNIVAPGADHLFARSREHAYILAMLRALDVAIRNLDPRPDPTATASESLTIRSR